MKIFIMKIIQLNLLQKIVSFKAASHEIVNHMWINMRRIKTVLIVIPFYD